MKSWLAPLLFTLWPWMAYAQGFSNWEPGYFDIHHINTGSGNSTFFIFPDGTTLLLDAGEVDRSARTKNPNPLKIAPRLPNDSYSAAQSIFHYIQMVQPGLKKLDFAVITHFHSDHYGSVTSDARLSANGSYKLTGITEVNEYLPIRKLIDRDYPAYNFPDNFDHRMFDSATFSNYRKFIRFRDHAKDLSTESLLAGSATQIGLLADPSRYPSFQVRNIKCNGKIWSGHDDTTIEIIAEESLANDYNENPLSLALKFSYGNFDYFTGGDMTGLQGFGLPSWFDVETPVANVVGEVDALTLNHHGVRDATNEFFLTTLAPRVVVQQSWSSNHPGEEVLHRLISPLPNNGKRDLFATFIHEETKATYGRWLTENYKSMRGHILLRVLPGGNEYVVYILSDTRMEPVILNRFGPYYTR